MPAAVETMMYAGEVPWHGEGTYVGDRDVDSATAIEAAGLDWTVEVQPVYLGNGDSIPGNRVLYSPKGLVSVIPQACWTLTLYLV